MAIKNSKTNTPKEQDGKTGQQMAGRAGRYIATSPYPTFIPKELDPKTYIKYDPSKVKTKKVRKK